MLNSNQMHGARMGRDEKKKSIGFLNPRCELRDRVEITTHKM